MKKKAEETKIEEPSKKVSKKQKKEAEKKTLIELVNETNINRLYLINYLGDNDLLAQFYEEERKLEMKEYIEPSITEDEFKKIIGG